MIGLASSHVLRARSERDTEVRGGSTRAWPRVWLRRAPSSEAVRQQSPQHPPQHPPQHAPQHDAHRQMRWQRVEKADARS
eukprot:6174320-Pleurochrysis_carterae.AAC.4